MALTFVAIFQHANVRLNLGPFRWLVANPQYHHWHHANHVEALDTNFSAGLPLIDLVFGPAWCPAGEWPLAYGSPEPVPDHWFAQMAYPFVPAPHLEASNGC